jgi:hypothetical protein
MNLNVPSSNRVAQVNLKLNLNKLHANRMDHPEETQTNDESEDFKKIPPNLIGLPS